MAGITCIMVHLDFEIKIIEFFGSLHNVAIKHAQLFLSILIYSCKIKHYILDCRQHGCVVAIKVFNSFRNWVKKYQTFFRSLKTFI